MARSPFYRLFNVAAEDRAGIDSTEAEGIAHHEIEALRTAVVWHDIQRASRVLILKVQGGGKIAPLDGEGAERRLDDPVAPSGWAV